MDPSRAVVLNAGFSPPPRNAAQAWYEPWNDNIHRSDKEPFALWWNNHQGAGDQWYDEFYKSPTDFTYRSPYHQYLTEFGEMEGCATPDNHALMVHQITETYLMYGGNSYDLTDHKEILAAYDKFLDQWKFREAFPTAEHLFNALGKKCYDTWANYLENARISDDLDFAVISGWETTAIENHSGIVDNLRNFKSDPAPITGALTPIRPVAKQCSACTARGESATFDLYLLNDTPQPATGTLTFTAITPSNKLLKLTELPAPPHVTDQFSYLLKEAFQTPPLNEKGLYRFKFSLSSAPLSTQTKEIWVTEPPAYKRARALNIATSDITPTLHKQLTDLGPRLGLEIEGFTPGKKYDVIVSSGLTTHTSASQSSGDTTGLEAQPTSDVGVIQSTTQLGHIDSAILEAVRAGTPLLAIPQADTLSDGVARQLAAAGAFTYNGTVGDYRAPLDGQLVLCPRAPNLRRPPRQSGHGHPLPDQRPPGERPPNRKTSRRRGRRNHRRLQPRSRPQHRSRHLHHKIRRRKNPLPPRPRSAPRPARTLPRQRPRLAHQLNTLKAEEAALASCLLP
jgi:beta-galactosidase